MEKGTYRGSPSLKVSATSRGGEAAPGCGRTTVPTARWVQGQLLRHGHLGKQQILLETSPSGDQRKNTARANHRAQPCCQRRQCRLLDFTLKHCKASSWSGTAARTQHKGHLVGHGRRGPENPWATQGFLILDPQLRGGRRPFLFRSQEFSEAGRVAQPPWEGSGPTGSAPFAGRTLAWGLCLVLGQWTCGFW